MADFLEDVTRALQKIIFTVAYNVEAVGLRDVPLFAITQVTGRRRGGPLRWRKRKRK